MRAKSAKRILAERLRLELGYSYSEISTQIGVSKSTLSDWLKYIPLTHDQEQRLHERIVNNQTSFVAKARKANQERFQATRMQAFQGGTFTYNNTYLYERLRGVYSAYLTATLK